MDCVFEQKNEKGETYGEIVFNLTFSILSSKRKWMDECSASTKKRISAKEILFLFFAFFVCFITYGHASFPLVLGICVFFGLGYLFFRDAINIVPDKKHAQKIQNFAEKETELMEVLFNVWKTLFPDEMKDVSLMAFRIHIFPAIARTVMDKIEETV